ncbi:MAG: MFS transporter [Burkholderiales bacterium]
MIIPHTFRALRHPLFRRFFFCQAVSILGHWMQQIALQWLVYRTTGSAAMLGLVAFANQAPILFIAPFSGVLADRLDRRMLLITTQSFAALQALLLGMLVLYGAFTIWHLVAMALMFGIVAGLDTPVRHSLFVTMVEDRNDLPNAIALNSFLMNNGRLIGPSIAGIALIYVQEGYCFLFNALSYLGVVWVATTLPRLKPSREVAVTGFIHSIGSAAGYAWRTHPIRELLALIACIAFFGSSYIVLMPVFARDVFGGGSETLGFLVGCAGFGAVMGTAFLASRGNIDRLQRRLIFSGTLAGAALLGVGLSQWLWVTFILMVLLGFGIIVTAAGTNMILQSVVDDSKRGRVVSFYTMSFLGMVPFGALAGGNLANVIGAPRTAALFGAVCIIAALLLGQQLRRQAPPGKSQQPASG